MVQQLLQGAIPIIVPPSPFGLVSALERCVTAETARTRRLRVPVVPRCVHRSARSPDRTCEPVPTSKAESGMTPNRPNLRLGYSRGPAQGLDEAVQGGPTANSTVDQRLADERVVVPAGCGLPVRRERVGIGEVRRVERDHPDPCGRGRLDWISTNPAWSASAL